MRILCCLVSVMEIHIQRDEVPLGVFSYEEAKAGLRAGKLTAEDLAWMDGMETWSALESVCAQLDTQQAAAAAAGESPADTFGQGRYRYQNKLGQGAFGEVWLAYDQQLDRPVAVKLLHHRSVASTDGLSSLKGEVQKCLELTHPNIIRIYDLAEPPGEHAFISMEYVSGEDLSARLHQQPERRFSWPTIEPYLLCLCDALAYSHKQGMVHRDLKPGNVMVDTQGEVKLADFGISATTKVAGNESTVQVPRAGTPIYWSPQQSVGQVPAPTDDIYSLGIMLYQLLVGDPPFLGANEPEITQKHWTQIPVPPNEALKAKGAAQIPGYVNDLILKCLAKDPLGRPQTLAEVRAWLQVKGDPAMRRQKRMALAVAASVALMLVMGALAVWATMQKGRAEKAQAAEAEQRGLAEDREKEAETARAEAVRQQELLKRENYISTIALGQAQIESGAYQRAEDKLWATPNELRNWEWGRVMHAGNQALQTFAAHFVKTRLTERVVLDTAFSPDGSQVLTGGGDGAARLWDVRTGQRLLELEGHSNAVRAVAFAQAGRLMVTASTDGKVNLWRSDDGTPVNAFQSHAKQLTGMAITADGGRVATCGKDGSVQLWDAATGERLRRWSENGMQLNTVAFSKDSRQLAAAGFSKHSFVWDIESGEEVARLTDTGQQRNIRCIDFSPDGKRLITGNMYGMVNTWNLESGKVQHLFAGHTSMVHKVRFSKDGSLAISCSSDRSAIVWDTAEGRKLAVIRGQSGRLYATAISPDSRLVVTGNHEGVVQLWDAKLNRGLDGKWAASDPGVVTIKSIGNIAEAMALTSDSQRLVIAGHSTVPWVYDTATGHRLHAVNANCPPGKMVRLSPDGKLFMHFSKNNTIQIMELETGRRISTLDKVRGQLRAAGFSDDSSRLFVMTPDRSLGVWDVATGQLLRPMQGSKRLAASYAGAFSSDNRQLFVGSNAKIGILWNVETGEVIRTFKGHTLPVHTVAIAPDGQWVLTGSGDKTARLWDAATGRSLAVFRGHDDIVTSVAFSPDGRRVLTGGFDQVAKIWDPITGRELLTLRGHGAPVSRALFSNDGRIIATSDLTGHHKIWPALDWQLNKDEFDEIQKNNYESWTQLEARRAVTAPEQKYVGNFARYRSFARRGNVNAQHFIGRVYLEGTAGVESDLLEAFVWLTLAHANGHADAKARLNLVMQKLSANRLKEAKELLAQTVAANPLAAPAGAGAN